jgi:hypothetical protein
MPQLQLPLPNTNTNIACTFAFMATPCCSCYCPCLTLTQTHSSFDPSSHTHTCHVNRRSAHSHSISFRSKNSTPALFTSFTRTSDTLRPTVCFFHVWACGDQVTCPVPVQAMDPFRLAEVWDQIDAHMQHWWMQHSFRPEQTVWKMELTSLGIHFIHTTILEEEDHSVSSVVPTVLPLLDSAC